MEGAAGQRVRRQERQRQQRFMKEPGGGRESPQGLRAVARLAPGAGAESGSSSSEEVWEDAQAPGPVLTLKRLFWQEHGVERRTVATQTDPVAIMSAGAVLTSGTGVAEKVLAKELRPPQHGILQGTTSPKTHPNRPPCNPYNVNSQPRRQLPRVNSMPEVEIRVDEREPRVEERTERGRWQTEPLIAAEAEQLALEAGLAELTRESVDRGWGRRVESVLGTVYDVAVPSFARFWEQDDPFGIISGGTR